MRPKLFAGPQNILLTAALDHPSLEALPDLTISISPLLVIAGPTASGKSALALHLARIFGGEIVNCDSLQIFRGMNIGTAKPTIAEREELPHHLYDARNPDEVFTAGEYSRIARPILRDIASRHHLPIVTGGAGFYLKALLDGLFPGPLRSTPLRVRLDRLETKYPSSLHRILTCWDPTSALRIHANDVNKLIRAIEIIWCERTPLIKAHEKQRGKLEGFSSLKFILNPPRAELRQRIESRVNRMFEEGLVEEVAKLREAGFGPNAKAMESVGYRQTQAFLDGRIDLPEAISDTILRTAQYAKRQVTWFRRESKTDPKILWLEGFGGDSALQALAESHLKQLLT